MNTTKKVVGKIKKFDKKLYDKYDIPARNIVKEKLMEYVSDNPNVYAEDLLLNIPDLKYKFLELQVCTKWIEEKFPYDKPFVYSRKNNFSDSTLFLILNKNMTRGLLFDKASLLKTPRRLKKFSRFFVYEVPWNRILNINIDDLNCETIRAY
jgi:hypothetical protein